MKCANCNGINVEGTRFCMYCGADMMQAGMRQMQPQMNQGRQPQQQMYQQTPQQRVKLQPNNRPAKRQLSPVERKKRNRIIAIASGAAAFVVLLIILIAASNSVDVKDYVNVEFFGENGNGQATAFIDKDKFIMDYTGKIKYSDDYKMERTALNELVGYGNSLDDERAAYRFIRDGVTVTCEDKNGLSNGDTVKVHIKYDKRELKKYDLDLEDETFEVKVSGLGKNNSKKKSSGKKSHKKELFDTSNWDF